MLSELQNRRRDYFKKVEAIGKPPEKMANDELLIFLEYAFLVYECDEVEIASLKSMQEFTLDQIVATEQRLAGHNFRAATFNQCRCQWCLNNSPASRMLS